MVLLLRLIKNNILVKCYHAGIQVHILTIGLDLALDRTTAELPLIPHHVVILHGGELVTMCIHLQLLVVSALGQPLTLLFPYLVMLLLV